MAGGATPQMKSTMTTVFHPCPEGKTAQTVLCYANLNIDTSIGFMNAKVKITEDGLTGAVQSYAQQGYRLCGMELPTASSNMSMGSASSQCTAGLVFQALLVEDQFMLGARFMVAPVLQENATSRDVYLPPLPKGTVWKNVFTGAETDTSGGGKNISEATVKLDEFPLYKRHETFHY